MMFGTRTSTRPIREHAERGCAFADHRGAVQRDDKDERADDQRAQPVRQTGERLNGRAAGRKRRRRSRADHDKVADLIQIAHDRAGPAVQAVGKAAVVIGFVLIGIAHAVPEEQRVQTLRQRRKDEAPDTVIDEILVDLRAGGKAAAELRGECDKRDAHGKRHPAFVNEQCFFLVHVSFSSFSPYLLNSMTLPGLRMSLSSNASLMDL